jgi:hypothetical protein
MTALRLGVLVAALVGAAVVASSAHAALFFLFKPTTADAGDFVTVRLGGTQASFTLADRVKPFRRRMRLYLVRNDVAAAVSSRFDRRLHFVGHLVPDANGRGVLRFRVPPLDTARYAVAAWCPECARNSFGRTFFVLPVAPGGVGRFRDLQLLRVRTAATAKSCPVTRGRYDNGFLSVDLRGGVLSRPRDPDGTLSDKLGWLPRKGFTGRLTVRGERLDAPGKLDVLSVNWGYASSGPAANGSWASAVRFPSAGCWRITGRVRDISLSYVVKVVASS